MAKHGDVATGPGWELRCGDYREVLADVVECDAVITDPPYSERTHVGMRTGDALTGSGNPYVQSGVDYARMSEEDAREFARHWSERCDGWMVTINDHVLTPLLLDEQEACGRYAFAPIPFVELGKQPRLTGDGPANWTCWIGVSRPRSKRFAGWGSLPGAYVPRMAGVQRDRLIKGGKPLWLMKALVMDYSRRGDLVCDPYAGAATTLLAAAIEGRRAIGAELDPETFEKAVARLRNGYTPSMFARPQEVTGEQADMFPQDAARERRR